MIININQIFSSYHKFSSNTLERLQRVDRFYQKKSIKRLIFLLKGSGAKVFSRGEKACNKIFNSQKNLEKLTIDFSCGKILFQIYLCLKIAVFSFSEARILTFAVRSIVYDFQRKPGSPQEKIYEINQTKMEIIDFLE